MTKEQEEAIEILKQDLELAKKEDVIDIDVLTGYLEIALKLIQEQQVINEKKDKRIERQFKLLTKKDKEIKKVLELIFQYGQIDGEHHKMWVIDQTVRILAGKKYDKWINDYIYDEETGDCYSWNKGIAP